MRDTLTRLVRVGLMFVMLVAAVASLLYGLSVYISPQPFLVCGIIAVGLVSSFTVGCARRPRHETQGLLRAYLLNLDHVTNAVAVSPVGRAVGWIGGMRSRFKAWRASPPPKVKRKRTVKKATGNTRPKPARAPRRPVPVVASDRDDDTDNDDDDSTPPPPRRKPVSLLDDAAVDASLVG